MNGSEDEVVRVRVDVNQQQLDILKKDIQSCNTQVEIDAVINKHGFSDISDEIKELKNNGEIDSLTLDKVDNIVDLKNRSLIAEQATGFKGVSEAIKKYNELLNEGTGEHEAFAKQVAGTNVKLGDYLSGIHSGTAGMKGYIGSLIKATAAEVGMTIAATALNAAISFGLSLAIEGLVAGINYLIHSQEIEAQKLQDATELVEEYQKSMNDLQKETKENAATARELGKEYSKLFNGVDAKTKQNISLTNEEYERFLEINNQLADLFPSLTRKYDDNGNAIVDLGKDAQETSDKIEHLIKQKQILADMELQEQLKTYIEGDDNREGASDLLDRYEEKLDEQEARKKAIDEAKDKWDRTFKGETHQNTPEMDEMIDMAAKRMGYSGKQDLFDEANNTLKEGKNKQKLKETVNEVYDEISSEFALNISDLKNKIEIYNEGISQALMSFVDDQDVYQNNPYLQETIEKLVNGIDWSKINGLDTQEEYENYIKQHVLKPIQMGLDGDKLGITFTSIFQLDQEKFPSYQEYVKAVKKKTEKLKGWKDVHGNRIKSDQEIKDIEQTMGVSDTNENGEVSGQALIDEVKKKYPDLQSFILTLSEEGLRKLHAMTDKEASSLRDMIKAYGTDAITSLSDEDFKIAIGLDIDPEKTSWEELQIAIENAKSKMFSDLNQNSWDAFKDITDDQKNELIELAKQGKLTIETFNDKPASKNILDHFAMSAEAAVEAINKLVDRADQLNTLRSSISALSNNLATKKENGTKQGISSDVLAGMPEILRSCTKEWNKYEITMMNANSTYEDCKKVTDELASALINNENYLSGLTTETEQAYISELKAMGVMNAEEVVATALAKKTERLAAEKEWCKLNTEEQTRAMNGEIDGLKKEKGWTEKVAIAVKRLAFEKALHNKNALNTSASVQNLINLAKQCKVTAEAMDVLAEIQLLEAEIDNDYKNGMKQDAITAKEGKLSLLKSKIDFMEITSSLYADTGSNAEIDVDVSPTNDKTKDSKNKNSKDKKEETKTKFDWIERSLKMLQEKIDQTKAKFDNLFTYKEKKDNIKKQIEQTKALIDQTTAAIKKYRTESNKAFNKIGSKTITVDAITGKKVKTKENTKDLVSIAKKELGNYGGTKYKKYTGVFDAWCQSFVSWVTNKAGLSLSKAPKATSTIAAKKWFEKNGNFAKKGSGYIPQKNDLVYWWRKSENSGKGHVGIVTGYKNGKFTTIEGNHGNKVATATHSMNENRLLGFAKTSQYFDSSVNTKKVTLNSKKDVATYRQLITLELDDKKSRAKSINAAIQEVKEKKGKQIQAAIDEYDSLQTAIKSYQTLLKNLRELEKEYYQLDIDRAEAKKELYETEIQSTSNAKRKNDYLAKEIKQIEISYKYQIKQAQIDKDWVKVAQLRAKAYNEIVEAQKQMIQNTQDEVEVENSLLEAKNKNTNRKNKIKNYKTQSENLLNANKQIDKDVKKATKSSVVTNAAREMTNAESQQSGRTLLSSINSKLKKAGLSKKVLADIQDRLRNGQDIPQKYINKLKKIGQTSLANKLATYNKERKELLNENKKEYIKQINDTAETKKQENIASARELNSQTFQETIDAAEESLAKLSAEYDNLSTSKEKIGNLNSQLKQEQIAHEQRLLQIQNDYTDEAQRRTKIEEENAKWTKTQADNLAKQFDTIKEEVDMKNQLLSNGGDYIQSFIDLAEAKGKAIDEKWFDQIMLYNNGKMANIKAALPDMEKELKKMKPDSPDWYDAMNKYVAAATTINNLEKENWEIQQKKNELELKLYEKMASRMGFINDEYEFMLDMIQTGNEMFDAETGTITDAGLVTFAIKFDQMDLATEQIKNYKEELAKVEEQYKNGLLSLDDYEEKTEDLTKKIWDATKAHKGLEEAIIQMVKDGLDAQLSALDKMIEKYKKALSNEKDLYEYQKNIAKQTKNIATIQKQIAALSGDNSDEARSKIQKLKVQLQDAQDELKDTEYNKWYEDQNSMLDDLRDEISEAFDDIIKNHRDEILRNLMPVIRNASSKEKLEQFLDGYTMTTTMQQIQNSHETLQTAIREGQEDVSKSMSAVSEVTNELKYDINSFLNKFPTLDQLKETLRPLFDNIVTALSLYGSDNNPNEMNPNVVQAEPVPYTEVTTNEGNTTSQDKYSLSALEAFLSSRLTDVSSTSGMEKANIDSIMAKYASAKNIFDKYQGTKAVGSATVLQDLAKYLGVEFKDDVLLGMLNAIEKGDTSAIESYLNGSNQNQTETKLLSTGSVLGTMTDMSNQYFEGSAVDSEDKNAASSKVITKVQTYLSKNMVELSSASSSKKKQANELKDKYKSAKRLYNITDKKMALTSESQLQHIAELMGATKSNGSIDDALLYKKLVASGFKTGGIAKVVKRTGEDGIGLFRNGEGFVSPEHVPQIQELLKNIPQASMIMEDLNRKFAMPLGNRNGKIGGTTIGDISVHLDGSNVVDPKSFMDALDNAQVRSKVVKMVGNQIAKPYMNSLSRY